MKKNRTAKQNRTACGFTLVELLVVIGIIAVLISILLPAINRARRASFTTKCASNMRQIAMSVMSYAGNNKGRLPPTRVPDLGVSTIYPNGWFWANELARGKYVPSQTNNVDGRLYATSSVFQCPEGDAEIDPYVTNLRSSDSTYACDARNNMSVRYRYEEPSIATWYMLNSKQTATVTKLGNTKDAPFLLFHTMSGRNIDNDLRDPAFTRSISNVRKAAEVVMLMDGSEALNGISWKYIAGRHGSKSNNGRDAFANYAFFDGHVALLPTAPTSKLGPLAAELAAFKNETIFYLSNQQR